MQCLFFHSLRLLLLLLCLLLKHFLEFKALDLYLFFVLYTLVVVWNVREHYFLFSVQLLLEKHDVVEHFTAVQDVSLDYVAYHQKQALLHSV